MSAIDKARSVPITMLNVLNLRLLWRRRWTVAPNASHTKQLGNDARTKSAPRETDCTMGLPASALRKVPAALALTSHDFGLTHWSKEARSGGEGLERSCSRAIAGWIASARPVGGVELLRAWFAGEAYEKHRHDTYAIGLTDCGVQVFDYRGSVRTSARGQVVVLYPDEVHDGRAGTEEGFGYRIVYVEPSQLVEALRVLRRRPYPLPFVSEPVSTNARLSQAVEGAFRAPLEPLAVDSLIVDLAEGLIAAEQGGGRPVVSPRVDVGVIERARQFLDVEKTRVVHSTELESITGLTRYDLARQFKAMFGTSPYRYLLMRRLDFTRERTHHGRPLVEVACDAGFADQAHFTRAFKSAFGLTPARYRALRAGPSPSRGRRGQGEGGSA